MKGWTAELFSDRAERRDPHRQRTEYWRGHFIIRDRTMDADDTKVTSSGYLLAGERAYENLSWEGDADRWYEQQVLLMSERAPA